MHEFPLVQRFIEQGTEQTCTAIAIAILNDNLPIDTIVKYTGLSEAAIEPLTVSVRSAP